MSESTEAKKLRMKKAVIIRHRKRQKVCERCGMDPHDGDCIESYIKSDMRNIPIEPKTLDLKRKKDTILSYRRKKGLCEGCGMEPHKQPCHESYEKADNRSIEAKKDRPATVPTPKDKGTSIIEHMNYRKEIQVAIKPNQKIKLQRPFIVVNLFKSNKGNIVEFSCLCQLARKFQNHIICVIGKVEKHFPYSDVMKINKIPNIVEIKPCTEKNIVNHICSATKVFMFPSKIYTPICIKYNIKYYEFQTGKNATNFFPDTAYRI